MPANLNALIRYKTINACLSGGMKRWSIQELIEKCSEALAEYRGRYEPVSERTIRDDIRVMRSEILGYNAPIIQERGQYYYSDPGYSIMSIRFTDSDLVKRIILLLGDIRKEISHPELELVLERLKQMQHHEPLPAKPAASIQSGKPEVKDDREDDSIVIRQETEFKKKMIEKLACKFNRMFEDLEEPGLFEPQTPESELSWADLFGLLGK